MLWECIFFKNSVILTFFSFLYFFLFPFTVDGREEQYHHFSTALVNEICQSFFGSLNCLSLARGVELPIFIDFSFISHYFQWFLGSWHPLTHMHTFIISVIEHLAILLSGSPDFVEPEMTHFYIALWFGFFFFSIRVNFQFSCRFGVLRVSCCTVETWMAVLCNEFPTVLALNRNVIRDCVRWLAGWLVVGLYHSDGYYTSIAIYVITTTSMCGLLVVFLLSFPSSIFFFSVSNQRAESNIIMKKCKSGKSTNTCI
jgi:hypothetical protein